MAVLAPKDWHPPRDYTMDATSSNSISNSLPRNRASPPNEHSPASSPVSQQQPYPYPLPQQQPAWNPAHQQQFYQSFYQNPHQPSFPLHAHPAQQQIHQQNPYFDPAGAQLAQWAYQQMMFTAHQQGHQMSHVPSPLAGQRSRAGSASQQDYYANYNIFPSGTPPPHPSQLPNGYPAGQGDHPAQQQNQYGGFHPYRRPNRQNSHNQDIQQQSLNPSDWRSQQHSPPPSGSISPPYARADAAGSSTSVNSHNSGSTRQRTNSNQGSSAGGPGSGSQSGHGHAKQQVVTNGHGRIGSATSNSSQQQQHQQSNTTSSQRPHQRTASSASSSGSGAPRPSLASSATSTSSSAATTTTTSTSTLRRPSPLSQGTFTAAEKRMSRDDSDLAAMLEPASAPGVRSGGLKGRLRRALSLNAGGVLREEDEDQAITSSAKGKSSARTAGTGAAGSSSAGGVGAGDDDESTATVQKKKSRSLFNSRLNRSTDNISLSSTMSSASMVIRKLGSIGKLTRRNSLAGITSLFKDKKDKDKDGAEGSGDGKKSKKKKGEKGNVAEASVSHVTAELDRSEWSQDMSGLSPAARLARQHTLKSNAEAAAKAKAEAEARAAAAAQAQHQQSLTDASNLPTTWEKNTTTRHGEVGGKGKGVANEDGIRVMVEDDSDSDDGAQHGVQNLSMDGWDDDEDWGEAQEEEDMTIRQGLEGASLDDEDMEPWAMGIRRSIERTRRPTKGILKTRADGSGYEQDTFQKPNAPFSRHRANSYDSPPSQGPELGPLAHIPSEDPDLIDGIHKHHPHLSSSSSASSSSTTNTATPSFLPPLSFETTSTLSSSSPHLESPKGSSESPSTATSTPTIHSPENRLFTHPNSSAPALSTMFSSSSNPPPTLTHRSATAPAKRLAFAKDLSVYDTFSASVYDRRSEPATWSRLTPALAQRIKEELNSYKMEEMEVHASSRVHTQFFV